MRGAVKVDLAELDHHRFGARDHQGRAALSRREQVRLGQIQIGLEGRAPDGLCQFPGDFGRHPHGESDGMRSGHWHLLLMPRPTTARR